LTIQLLVSLLLAVLGVACLVLAVVQERRMHRHRQPGVSYADATLRRDGGWRRSDLFTPAGLSHQRRASAYGVAGSVLLLASLVAWAVLRAR
jgi:hypothetical protein